MSQTLFDAHDGTAAPLEDHRRNGAGTAALVLGLLSLVLSVVTGVPAVIAGVVGLARARSRRAGWASSSVGLVMGLASVAVAVAVVHYLVPVYETVKTVRTYQAQGVPAADSPEGRKAIAEGERALAQVGVDPGSVSCRTPSPSGTSVTVGCTGTTTDGAPAEIEGSCPMASLLRGEATCRATVNGEPHSIRVALHDGVPDVQVL